MKVVDELLKKPGAWMKVGAPPGVMVSSRVRLARNLEGVAFPGWAGEEESLRLWQALRPILEALPGCAAPVALEMEGLSRVDKEILIERHLISRDLAEKGRGSGLVFKADETVVIMVNEEDHIRMQAMSSGLSLRGLWQTIDGLDTDLERQVRYAFSPRLGYLTACPTNVGTGMRASVMLHLPGLVLMNEINPIIKGVNKIGLAVRGLWGRRHGCGGKHVPDFQPGHARRNRRYHYQPLRTDCPGSRGAREACQGAATPAKGNFAEGSRGAGLRNFNPCLPAEFQGDAGYAFRPALGN